MANHARPSSDIVVRCVDNINGSLSLNNSDGSATKTVARYVVSGIINGALILGPVLAEVPYYGLGNRMLVAIPQDILRMGMDSYKVDPKNLALDTAALAGHTLVLIGASYYALPVAIIDISNRIIFQGSLERKAQSLITTAYDRINSVLGKRDRDDLESGVASSVAAEKVDESEESSEEAEESSVYDNDSSYEASSDNEDNRSSLSEDKGSGRYVVPQRTSPRATKGKSPDRLQL
jgi:hypothetical protein